MLKIFKSTLRISNTIVILYIILGLTKNITQHHINITHITVTVIQLGNLVEYYKNY